MDRSAINRALAKAMAYEQCGKPGDRDQWARELIKLLNASGILRDSLAHPLDSERDYYV